MGRFASIIVLVILLFSGVAHPSINEHFIQPETEILEAEFGIFNLSESGKSVFIPSLKIPFLENQRYGWIIVLKTKKDKVKWREELILPEPPETWGEGVKQSLHIVSSDRRACITEREEEHYQGLILNFWEIAQGDPKGSYVIRVVIDDGSEIVFKFIVE
jgi:hypothetical protein